MYRKLSILGLFGLLILSTGSWAEPVEGRMFSPGVTGQSASNPKGWMEEIVYLAPADGSAAIGASTHHTPSGDFRIGGEIPAGPFTLFTMKFDGIPAFDFQTGTEFPEGAEKLSDVAFETSAHYSVMYDRGPEEWGEHPWLPGTSFFQTFVAKTPHVTRIATRLADKTPMYTQLVLNYAIYSVTDGPPSEWERISPVRTRVLTPTTDPIIHIFWVSYRSEEVILEVGKTYAFRLWRDETSQSEEFVVVARRKGDAGYADGHLWVGDEPRKDWDAFGYVSGGKDGTVVNYIPLDGFDAGDLLGWNSRFGQTFRATGTGLAAVDFAYATGQESPSAPVTFQLYDSVGGEPIGPAKTCASGPSGAFQGRLAVFWERGEVSLEPGKIYYIEGTSPGYNVWAMKGDIPGVEAYIDGESKAPKDMALSIAEYTD